ncbi:hypothetical protein [Streptomyces albidoflavus]|uniref:hypothetical protein n=1 Tax=Streptomyces albidoflavus TaxID=1886 RepID=UPI0033DA806D
MANALGSITSLAPAAPGWTVTVTSPVTGDPVTCPIASWASMVTTFDRNGCDLAEVQPVFVMHGSLWTHYDLEQVKATVFQINPPAAPEVGA